MRRAGFGVVVSVLFVAVTVRPVVAQTAIEVTTTNQFRPGCTLSDAIVAANLDIPFGDCPTGLGKDTIHLPAGEYVLTTPAVIEDVDRTGLPLLTMAIAIRGDGAATTVIKRDPNAVPFRLLKAQAPLVLAGFTLEGGDAGAWRDGGAIVAETFYVTNLPGGTARMMVYLRDVVFRNNRALSGGALADAGFYYGPFAEFDIEGGVFVDNVATNYGGAIRISPEAALKVRHSRFERNHAGAAGGAIQVNDSAPALIELTDSTFSANVSGMTGGAVQASSPVLTRVTLLDNSARDGGGALYSYGGRPVMRGSTISGNSARRGGAIEVHGGSIDIASSTFANNIATDFTAGALHLDDRVGTSRIANSTFSNNSAPDRGGAIYLYGGGLTFNNVTITGNRAGYGAGIALGWWGGSQVTIANSIVAGNRATWNAALDVQVDDHERLISLGHNVIGSDLGTRGLFAAPGDQVGTADSPLDAALLPLTDNGGPAPTHALAPFSPALDGGSDALPGIAGACEPADQRDRTRPGPGTARCDSGAYEHGVYHALQLTVSGGGDVTGFPGVTSCATTCTVELGAGTVITLTANPAPGFTVAGWSGACAGAALTCEITMNGQQAVGVVFAANGGETTTSLSSSPNPSADGEEITLTARVTVIAPGAGQPTGMVRFLETTAATILGEVEVDADGYAVLKTSALPQGVRAIQALYDGDEWFGPSNSTTLTHRVGVEANVAPSFSIPALPAAILEDAGPQSIADFATVMIAGPPSESSQTFLGFTITPTHVSGDVGFVSGPTLALDGTLAYEVAANTNGTASFRVTLQDDGGIEAGGADTSAPQDFTITVTPVNDAPSLSLASDLPATLEDGGRQTFTNFATASGFGHQNESSQAVLSYVVTQTVSHGLAFAEGPAIDAATGTLIYTAAPNRYGSASFSVVMRDNGGTADAGVDTSAPQIFTITVNPVNDPPTILNPGTQKHTDLEAISVDITATDVDDDDLQFAAAGLPPGLSIDPHTGRIAGTANRVEELQTFPVTLTVTDEDGLTAAAAFDWTITHVVPPPAVVVLIESVAIADVIAVAPAVLIAAPEQIVVADSMDVAPALMLAMAEQIAVAESTLGQAVPSITIAEIIGVQDSIVAVAPNTPTGLGVTVVPATGVSVTFTSVSKSGTTTAVNGPVPPAPFDLVDTQPPTAMDIATTAVFQGPVEICLAHPPQTLAPRLMHFELGAWIDRTTTRHRTANVICGSVSSLSPFAVMSPRGRSGRMTGHGKLSSHQQVAFDIVQRTGASPGGSLELTQASSGEGAAKRERDVFRSSTIDAVLLWDEGTTTRVFAAGRGTWNGEAGHTFEVEAVDAGESGRHRDTIDVWIRNPSGQVVLAFRRALSSGNIQSHRNSKQED